MDNKASEITALTVFEESSEALGQNATSDIPSVEDAQSDMPASSASSAAVGPDVGESAKTHARYISGIAKTIAFRVVPSALAAVSLLVYATLGAALISGRDLTFVRFVKSVLHELSPDVIYSEALARPDTISNDDSGNGGLPNTPGSLTDEIILPDNRSELPYVSENSKSDHGEKSITPKADKTAPDRITIDMSSDAEYSLGLINETPYEADLFGLSMTERTIPPYAPDGSQDDPIVLIIHTHTSEGYIDTAATGFRSDDPELGVRAVGEAVASFLIGRGIPTIHCQEVFDSPDFNMAYYNAALAIKKYLLDHPSIRYIIDLHRDSILSSEKGVQAAPLTEADGENAAQLMFVVGTDHGGSGHTSWRDNLSLAARMQRSIAEQYPSLMRDINLRSASFNEQYTSGSLLLEVGSAASTIDEAVLSGMIFAEYFADEILGGA